jgi:hypothetical protein
LSIREFSTVVSSTASGLSADRQKRRKTMKRNNWLRISALLPITLRLAAGAAGQDLTPTDREQALTYLAETRKGVLEATKGLTEAQWKFKPAPDRWSAAEVVEHLVLIEDLVQGILAKIGQAPAGSPDLDPKQVDAMILARVPDRTEKAQAPPPALPSGRWTSAGTLERFLKSRGQTTEILRSASELRGHVIAHPVFGPLDGYEWILATAAHSARHTKQILEVKADPQFPGGSNSGH